MNGKAYNSHVSNDSEVDIFVRKYNSLSLVERNNISSELLTIIIKLLKKESCFFTITQEEMDKFIDVITDYSIFSKACENSRIPSAFIHPQSPGTITEQLGRQGLIINEVKLTIKIDNLILNEICEYEDIYNLQKLRTKIDEQIVKNSHMRIRELHVGLAAIKFNLGKMYYSLKKEKEAEKYISEYLYHAADLYITDKILGYWQYSIDLLISLRKDNIELYIQELNESLESNKDQNQQLVSNKILTELYKQQKNPLQYEFFTKAYKLQQAPLDQEAIIIGQKEAGFSNNIKIGTSDIRECMVLIIHEPIDHCTVLVHIDSSMRIEFALDAAMSRFDQNKYLSVMIVGARYISRDFDGYEDSEFNLVRTLVTLFKYPNICIKSLDIGDTIPFSIVFDPIHGQLKEAYPNKVLYGHNPDFAWQDLGHNIHFVFDCIEDDIRYYPINFDDESIKKAINTFLFQEKTFFDTNREYSYYQKHKFHEFCNYFRSNDFALFIKSICYPEELDSISLRELHSKISNINIPLYQVQLEIQEHLDTIITGESRSAYSNQDDH